MNQTTQAVTDVPEFITDLDSGNFDRNLSIALSKVAAAVTDHQKNGQVNITLKFQPIPGSHQIRCIHTLSFAKPTMDGKSTEEEERSTVLFVGKFGKLSLAQEPLFPKQEKLA